MILSRGCRSVNHQSFSCLIHLRNFFLFFFSLYLKQCLVIRFHSSLIGPLVSLMHQWSKLCRGSLKAEKMFLFDSTWSNEVFSLLFRTTWTGHSCACRSMILYWFTNATSSNWCSIILMFVFNSFLYSVTFFYYIQDYSSFKTELYFKLGTDFENM